MPSHSARPVAMLLLGLLGVMIAAASCQPPDGPVDVTARLVDCEARVMAATCTQQASDARVSGRVDFSLRCAIEDDLISCWGPMVLTGSQGTWEGPVESTRGHVVGGRLAWQEFEADLMGTGSYAGLRYRAAWGGAEPPWSVAGSIGPAE